MTLNNRKKKNFNSFVLSNNYKCLSEKESLAIVGGDPSAAEITVLLSSLNSIFVRTGTCDVNLWQVFNNQISALATTNVGYDLLQQIVDGAHGRTISITGIDPGIGKNGAQYDETTGSGGSINLGALQPLEAPSAWDYTKQVAIDFGSITHELFHSYSFITTSGTSAYQVYSRSVRHELDAFLFEALANAEIDGKNNISDANKSYAYSDYNIYNTTNLIPSGANANSVYAFQAAYYDMFHNKNFTAANYDILVANFTKSSTAGVFYSYLAPSAPLTQEEFKTSEIGKFYSNDFSKSSYFNNYVPIFPFNPPAPLKPLSLADPNHPSNDPTYNPLAPDSAPGGIVTSPGGGLTTAQNTGNSNSTQGNQNGSSTGDGGTVWIYNDVSPNSGSGSGSSTSSPSSSGSTASGGQAGGGVTRAFHFAGSFGAVWDDTGEQLTPTEMLAAGIDPASSLPSMTMTGLENLPLDRLAPTALVP